ncbi:MAG: anti-sigma factor family protein [Egibacteraceae bacterium]
MVEDLPCNELVEIVTDYLEGLLAPGERARFEDHLAQCPGCEAYLDQMRRTIALTGSLRACDVPPDVMAQLVSAFHTHRPNQRG